MALPTVYGIDPGETWEIDLQRSIAERAIVIGQRVAASLRADEARETDAEKKAALEYAAKSSEATVAQMREGLAAYDGGGPIFIVGPLPNGKRGALGGESVELSGLESEKERGERSERWAEEVVRWTIRGHRNLMRRDGSEIPFVTETAAWAGEERALVSRATLECYGPFLRDLAEAALKSQRMDEAGKNA